MNAMEREKHEVQRAMRGWSSCQQVGHHFFRRDYLLGIIPIGPPYCMWCGTTAGASVRAGSET